MLGIAARQRYVRGVDNIGYLVPTNVIQRFLDGVKKKGSHVDFVLPGFKYQNIASSALRKRCGLDQLDASKLPNGITATGILVKDVDELNNERFRKENPTKLNIGLKKNDVILSFNGIDVDEDGTIQLRYDIFFH